MGQWVTPKAHQHSFQSACRAMEVLLLILLVVVIYLLRQNLTLQRRLRTPKTKQFEVNTERPSDSVEQTPTPRPTPASNPTTAPPPSPKRDRLPTVDSKSNRTPRRSHTARHPTLDTGISELDGPGMYQRLTQCGPNGHVLYLLYSEQHGAYKVGIIEPDRVGARIKLIRESVPDVKLVGTAVFTSRQNAFDKEQEVLQRYKAHQYRGITGRYAGVQEWIKVRPSGRPYFTTPEKVEEKFQEEALRPAKSLEIPDKYTVYLLHSEEKDLYLANWCLTTNLNEKIATARRTVRDARLVSRFKIEESHKAREITKRMNEEDGTYIRNGRRDEMNWIRNPSYLDKFRNWDKNGMRVDGP